MRQNVHNRGITFAQIFRYVRNYTDYREITEGIQSVKK